MDLHWNMGGSSTYHGKCRLLGDLRIQWDLVDTASSSGTKHRGGCCLAGPLNLKWCSEFFSIKKFHNNSKKKDTSDSNISLSPYNCMKCNFLQETKCVFSFLYLCTDVYF